MMMKNTIGISLGLLLMLVPNIVTPAVKIVGQLPTINSLYSHKVYAPYNYTKMVLEVSEEVGVDVDLLCAIIKVESNWQPTAIGYNSDSCDRGLGQINSKYEDWYVGKFGVEDYHWTDVRKNMELTARIIKWSCSPYDYVVQGVAAYNCGMSRVNKNAIPDSTKKYVEKVMKLYNSYKNRG
jgi:hypothetical protein